MCFVFNTMLKYVIVIQKLVHKKEVILLHSIVLDSFCPVVFSRGKVEALRWG